MQKNVNNEIAVFLKSLISNFKSLVSPKTIICRHQQHGHTFELGETNLLARPGIIVWQP